MIETQVLEFVLIVVRIAGFFVFFPVFKDGRVPHLVKTGFAFALGWLYLMGSQPVSSVTAEVVVSEVSWLRIVMAGTGEVLFGAGLGFAFGILIEPARIAGAYIGQEMGLTLAESTDPSTRRSTNVVMQVFESWAIILFFLSNTHHVLLHVVRASFLEFPVGQGLIAFPASAMAYQTDLASKWGLLIASPVGLCLFLTIIFLGLLMRAVPQMNIFSIGLAIRLGVGLVALVLFLPVMLQMLSRVLGHAPDIVDVLFRG